MSGFLLDTNVFSEFNRRGEPDYNVSRWLAAADTGSLYASVITFGEIRFGIELLPASKRRTELEQWFDQDLHLWFAGRMLPVNEAITNQWAALTAGPQLKGKTAVQL